MKQFLIILSVIILISLAIKFIPSKKVAFTTTDQRAEVAHLSHPLVESARAQIGIVNHYDTGYYAEGHPPEDRGACTDVIAQALSTLDFDIKEAIDADMRNNPERYPAEYDPNINFRRVVNVHTYLEHHAESLPTCTENDCMVGSDWQPGDIVTFDQIPGSLWHIAIISDKQTRDGIPYLIHNYGFGTTEDNKLQSWPAPITGHYRLSLENL